VVGPIVPPPTGTITPVDTPGDPICTRWRASVGLGNVYLGDHPTYWMRPDVPHDGYLGEFLMRSKAVIRD
jgi:hypothetical protein